MKRAIMWIDAAILANLLKLPEGISIAGCSADFHKGHTIGLFLQGDGLPEGADMSEVAAIYQRIEEANDFRFLEWQLYG